MTTKPNTQREVAERIVSEFAPLESGICRGNKVDKALAIIEPLLQSQQDEIDRLRGALEDSTSMLESMAEHEWEVDGPIDQQIEKNRQALKGNSNG